MTDLINVGYMVNGKIISNINLPFTYAEKVLEVGCGETPLMHNPNWVTMDYRKLSKVDIVADFEQKWPIEDCSYDGIYGTFIIEHISWRKVPFFLSECYRVLKPGGHIYMAGPNTLEQCKQIVAKGDITQHEVGLIFGGQDDGGWNAHKAAFSPNFETKLFEDAGFRNIKIEPWPGAITDMAVWGYKGGVMENGTKLNIGSFTVMTKGWVNCDILDLREYAKQNGYEFVQFDASKQIPYLENSVKLIIASHFLEHLTRQEGDQFLKEAFRVMESGGVIRITVPDTKSIASHFAAVDYGGKLGQSEIKKFYSDNEGVKNAEDEAEAFWNFITMGHKTAYDMEALITKMKKAGFIEVQKMGPGHSRSQEIQSETKDMYPDHSIYIEAIKPHNEVMIPKDTKISTEPTSTVKDIKGNSMLRIGLISTQFFGVPPKGYSGLEMVVWDLAWSLSELGHYVKLFAPDGSKAPLNGDVIFTGPPLDTLNTNWLSSEQHVWDVVSKNSNGLDLLHGHNWFGFEYLAKSNASNRVCHTQHGHLNTEWWCKSKPPYKLNFIGISQHMKQEYESQGIPSEYVYNGIDLSKYPYQEKKGDRLLFVGRLDSFKQPHIAIQVAKKLGLGIDVLGGTFVGDKAYMQSILDTRQDGLLTWPDATHEKKIELMQNAMCLIFPSKMGEPFGLVACEAMACGTPVVALNDGAISEVVKHKETGYICNDFDELVAAVQNLEIILPQDCRKRVEENFSRRIMAENYVKLYKRIIEGGEW